MHRHKLPSISIPGGCEPEQEAKRIYGGTESGPSFPSEEKRPHKYRGENGKLTFGVLTHIQIVSLEIHAAEKQHSRHGKT